MNLKDVGGRGRMLNVALLAAVLVGNGAAASPAVATSPTSGKAMPVATSGAPQGALDLRLPGLQSLHLQDLQQVVAFSDSEEADGPTIAAAPLLLDQSADSESSPAGIASLYWAVRHPTQAWRVLLPIQLDADHTDTEGRSSAGEPTT
jgi:hypothetical protein